jgi:hypothetical protein
MPSYSRGRGFPAATRTILACLGVVSTFALAACTTTEGTNALTDIATFEREVMTSTLVGVGMVPRDEKEETNERRAPLVLPRDTATLPAPSEETRVAELPEDSDSVQIDMTGLTDADLKRLRNARVVDLHTLSGRPLTEAETRKLTARMTAARVATGPRPLYLPPEEYFTTINGEDVVCMSKEGELVPLTHKDCPYEIRESIGHKQPESPGMLGGDPSRSLADSVGVD